MKKKTFRTIGLILAISTLVLVGCGGSTEEGLEDISVAEGEVLADSGVLVLKVNPELAIEYNQEGSVTDVVGRNDEGREILEEYPDFVGKESGLVLKELVALIGESGYFVEETEGEAKQIILELEAGSALPEDEFLEKMTSNVQTVASELEVDSDVYSNEDIMTLEEAKQIALEDAQITAEDATFDDKELDEEDDHLIFELEFDANGYEYEYEVHAVTGEIVKSERDHEEGHEASNQETEKDQTPKEQTEAPKEDTQHSDYIGMERAQEIALNHAGKSSSQARWDDLEFDFDDGVPHYEIEFDVGPNEYEYDIHAETGKVLEFEHELKTEQNTTNTEEVPAEKQPSASKEISKEEAINIALNHADLSRSQVVFDEVELEYEDGRKEWEVDFDHGNWEYEYEIDASNGNILDFEREYDD